ncbi:hypothetical protein E4U60_005564 [Claviceps pazoutovae]|uniref:Cytochrome P450 n=1 Tax=Claviceps pazoutovae TaxID=1649127 RepID=A0A9P7SF25_9HYPO|nr:hypothetical protein E4U60_005564 [Claviceps pazoutovae]
MSQPIPQPRGWPLLGNIFDVSPSNTWTSLKKLCEEHGEIFQITVLGHKLVFVGSVALAEEICDAKRFRKYVGGPIVEIRAAVHDALFTAFDHEPSWGIAHRILAPRLSAEAMKQQTFLDMRDTADELIAKWAARGPHIMEPLGELQRLNLEATTLALFGKKLNCLDGPEHPVLKAMEDATSEAILRPTRLALLNTLLYRGKFKAAIATLRNYGRDIVQERQQNSTEREDLLAAILEGRDSETGTGLTESQIIDEIISMPIGSSTAPCLLTSALLFLSEHPDALARARQELDAVVGSSSSGSRGSSSMRDLTPQDLDRLPYIQAIVRESLRLSFAAPGFNREPIPPADASSKAPIQLAGGKYQVAHNQPIIVVLAGVNRDPDVFEDPLAFWPERMMPEPFEKLPEGAKKWFGTGKRACIGREYAWQWSVLVLAMLVGRMEFELVRAPGQEGELERDGWFNYRPVKMTMRVEVRGREPLIGI